MRAKSELFQRSREERRAGFPSVTALVAALREERRYWSATDDSETSVDIRLQVVDGSWALHTGDASYDTDHRGYWGAGQLDTCDTNEQLTALANMMLVEASDALAQTPPSERSN